MVQNSNSGYMQKDYKMRTNFSFKNVKFITLDHMITYKLPRFKYYLIVI